MNNKLSRLTSLIKKCEAQLQAKNVEAADKTCQEILALWHAQHETNSATISAIGDFGKSLNEWGVEFSLQGDLIGAIHLCKLAWQILGIDLADRQELHNDRAAVLVSWGFALYDQSKSAEAVEKYAAAWQILGIDLADRPEHHNHRATVLINWGVALRKQRKYAEAEEKYTQAWQILGIDLANRPELDNDRAKVLMNWGNVLFNQGEYAEAVEKYTQAWQIRGIDLANRPELDNDRATVLMNWGIVLRNQGKYAEAEEKYAQAWQIRGIDLADRQELDNGRATVLMSWAVALYDQSKYAEAEVKYAAAWQTWGIDLADRPELDNDRATVLINWGVALHNQDKYAEAVEKYAQAWQILGIDLADRPELDNDRAGVLMNWAIALSIQGKYAEAEEKYTQAWQILGIDLANRQELDNDRASVLMNWGVVLRNQGKYAEAEVKYAQAWQIRGVDLADRPELDNDRSTVLMNWGVALYTQGKYAEAEEKYADAWQIVGVDLADRPELDNGRATVLMNCGNVLLNQGKYAEAEEKYAAAWQILGIDLADRPELDNGRATVLMNCGNVLLNQGKYAEAEEKYAQAWQILGIDLANRPELDNDRAGVLMSWAIALDSQGKYAEAEEKYAQAWQMRGIDLADRPELDNHRAAVLINWGNVLYNQGKYAEVEEKYAQAWQIWGIDLADRRDVDLDCFKLALNWQHCWSAMDKPQDWARKVSNELRRRLDGQPPIDVADWQDELWEKFTQFHLQWAQNSLNDNCPEYIINILSRVSNWRMVQNLLDELERKDSDELSPELQDYCELRLKLAKLQKALQEKELVINPQNEGLRISGIQSGEPSAELRQEIAALRQICRDVYQQKQAAQAKVAKLKGYAALSPEHSDIDSTAILNKLASQQAALIIFDYGNGDNVLNGALLLCDDKVHWHDLEHLTEGYHHLEDFEYHIRHTRSPIRRGDLRSDEDKTDSTDKYDKENLWDSLAQWVKNALWQPLAALTEGLESLILITQGSQSHSIPWQIGAPVAPTAIDRYPSLSLFAMDHGLLSKADCSKAQDIGVAHYHGSEHPLPFAQIEAQQLQTIYQKHAAVTEDYDYPNAKNAIGTFHVAGHGLHPDKQQTVAGAGIVVGKDTHWQLTQLSHNKASPQSVYLSCCVAGRSTDIAGEQYGVASVFLQKGTQEVVASQVSMEDGWSMALSVMTHTLRVEEGLSFKEALYQAQQMLAGTIPWNESARQGVISGWSVHLSSKLKQTLEAMFARPILMKTTKRTTNFLQSELSSEGFKHISSQLDIQNIPETWYIEFAEALHKEQANSATLSQLAQTYTDKLNPYWRKQPSPLILGSLLYTTHVYGRTQPV